MARPDKAAAVKEITAKFQDSDAALLTEYRGLRVADIAEVRNALREANAEYRVLKNTLARIAVRDVGYEDLAENLVGPTAIVFVKGDVVAAAKALDEAVKKFPVLVVKGGALKGGKLISAEDAKALAKLESREVLLTKIAMLFNQPAQMTVNVFAALLRDLGSMLGQVLAQKEAEAPVAEAPAEEAPAAEAPAEEAPAAEAPAEEAPAAEAPAEEAPAAEAPAEEAPAAEADPEEEESADSSSDDSSSDDEEGKEE